MIWRLTPSGPHDARAFDPRLPAVNQAAIDYLVAARQRGERIGLCRPVAKNTGCRGRVGQFFHRLPAIYDAGFADQFLSLVAAQRIRRVYCPVVMRCDFMRRFLAERQLPIELIGQSPIRQQVEAHRRLMARTQA